MGILHGYQARSYGKYLVLQQIQQGQGRKSHSGINHATKRVNNKVARYCYVPSFVIPYSTSMTCCRDRSSLLYFLTDEIVVEAVLAQFNHGFYAKVKFNLTTFFWL